MADRESSSETQNQIALQEEYLKSLEELEEGQLIDGKVVEIGPENVFVDVGYKSEGKIPIAEFQEKPTIGDTVSVVLVHKEGKSGAIVVSKNKADVKLFWKRLRQAFQDKEPVDGTIIKTNKGGFEVDLGYGVTAFNPISKTDVVRVEDPESYVGVKSKFLIERLYSENKVKIIVSRRGWLENEIERKRNEFFANVHVGDEVEGSVKSFTSFGAFIDLGGFDGLLHINDMSWGHVTRPKDYVKKGEAIRLKVIKIDEENRKINLSLKHFTPNPWSIFENKYHVDDTVRGKVTKLTDFGAFIEIEEGIEGLAHISELSWVKRINHPKEILKVGDEVDAKILAYDIEQGRVSLGLKQVHANPWNSIEHDFPVDMHLVGTVRKVTNAGAFVEIAEGIEGFLHVDDLSWTKKIKNPASMLKIGDQITVKVIEVDNEAHRIRLGVKQLTDDPWRSLAATYSRGSVIEGEVTSITDFGVFVRVFGDIEGLISKGNLGDSNRDDDSNPLEKYSKGDKVKAVVTDVNVAAQRLSLSVREYQKTIQREELSKYIHDERDEATVTLGDMLKNKGNDAFGS